jgi:hypothetical protein
VFNSLDFVFVIPGKLGGLVTHKNGDVLPLSVDFCRVQIPYVDLDGVLPFDWPRPEALIAGVPSGRRR